MKGAIDRDSFDKIVEWAYGTLPEEIRKLPDFPGIQVLDEPPQYVLKGKRRLPGRKPLGLYNGVPRTQRRHNDVMMAPNLIFVFRGPIQRCSKGDLRSEVKEVVWHEVAHWLGHSEAEVKELGLATISVKVGQAAHQLPEGEARNVLPPHSIADTTHDAEDAVEQRLRCIKCYSANVTCREVDKPSSYAGANEFDPILVHARSCTCNSCGFEWDDEDDE